MKDDTEALVDIANTSFCGCCHLRFRWKTFHVRSVAGRNMFSCDVLPPSHFRRRTTHYSNVHVRLAAVVLLLHFASENTPTSGPTRAARMHA